MRCGIGRIPRSRLDRLSLFGRDDDRASRIRSRTGGERRDRGARRKLAPRRIASTSGGDAGGLPHRPGGRDGTDPTVYYLARWGDCAAGLWFGVRDRADLGYLSNPAGEAPALGGRVLHVRQPDRPPARRFPDGLAVLPLRPDGGGHKPGIHGVLLRGYHEVRV